MSKEILSTIVLSLALLACTERQREGWEKRVEKISGEERRKAQGDTLNPSNFTLPEETQGLIGLETAVVTRQMIEDVLEVPAEIVPSPNNVASINAPMSGRITSLSVNLGSAVEKGAVIAVIENPQSLGQRFEVRSPLSGVVTMRAVNAGEWIESAKEMIDIIDYSTLHGVIRLYPDEQSRVRVGQAVEFESDGMIARGRLFILFPSVDPGTRTIEARAEISNPKGILKANSFATARILMRKKEAYVVPESALLHEEAHHTVFVKEGERFEKRSVEVGIRRNGLAEILGGLKAGDVVVSKGAYELKNKTFTSKGGEEGEEHE